ncbi:hypothetical protein LguiB_014050 [Lonicera macranthoides]
MHLWVTKGGKLKRGKKMQVWVVIVVYVVIIFWPFFKSTKKEGNAKCPCNCAM